jgi:pyruvate/2-oxoglutarate dehydrogenase complex dihydrolipoamide acyltransferase (E2) component
MTIYVILPKPGMGTEDGTILKWLKTEGERVNQGQPLVEVEFAKATEEIEAPVTGIMVRILVAEGETVAVSSKIAIIERS